MYHEIQVEKLVPNVIPGMTSILLVSPDDDHSTSLHIPVSPYAAHLDGHNQGVRAISLWLVISGEFNLREICFPNREQLLHDVYMQHQVAAFIGEEAVRIFLQNTLLSRIVVSETERAVWREAYRLGDNFVSGWYRTLSAAHGRAQKSLV